MGSKSGKIPSPQTTGSAAFLKCGNKKVDDDDEAFSEVDPTPTDWPDGSTVVWRRG